MINYENLVCRELNIPSIPKKKWDGEKSFKSGVAVLEMQDCRKVYAIATFDNENDKEPRIIKVFTLEQFSNISDIFVVPDYMDNDVENMDLDDESKAAAQAMLEEAKELENESTKNKAKDLPKNEYFFDHITNDEQAAAYIKDYNKRNKIKGRVPNTHDGLVMRLSVIYSETNNKKKKSKK